MACMLNMSNIPMITKINGYKIYHLVKYNFLSFFFPLLGWGINHL